MNETINTVVNYWHPLVSTGVVLTGIWASAYVLSWIIQWLWAFVDDSQAPRRNWVLSKLFDPKIDNEITDIRDLYPDIRKTERYDFHYSSNNRKYDIPDGWIYVGGFWNYLKFKNGTVVEKQDNSPIHKPEEIKHLGYLLICGLIWVAMGALYIWHISIWIVTIIVLMLSARMSRRGYKLIKSHIADKSVHVNYEN